MSKPKYDLEDLTIFATYDGVDAHTNFVAGVAGSALDIIRRHELEVERLQARERELETALTPLYDAGYDVIRRVAGDPDAPDHVDMLRALTGALQDARPLVAALAAVSAKTEDAS